MENGLYTLIQQSLYDIINLAYSMDFIQDLTLAIDLEYPIIIIAYPIKLLINTYNTLRYAYD